MHGPDGKIISPKEAAEMEREKEALLRELDLPEDMLAKLRKMHLTPERLMSMDIHQLRAIVQSVATLGSRLQREGPATDDELHAWIVANCHIDIPRVSVCDDHDAPFTFVADLYFERVGSALALGNRGGAKTTMVACLHFANANFKTGCEGLSFGATRGQGDRCYEHIEDWCYVHDENGAKTGEVKPFVDGEPMQSHTVWKTGSKIEVVSGSKQAVNGPHPQKAAADEIDLMKEETWTESRNMAVAKKATGPLPSWMKQKFGDIIPPQDIVTSTRKSRVGRMASLIKSVKEALQKNHIPQFTLYQWCIFETAAEQPNCRQAPKEERELRLAELGRDPCELCECHRAVKGKVKDPQNPTETVDRTLEWVCCGGKMNQGVGKFFRSRGWKPYVDLINTFLQNTPGTWKLQQECREGTDENVYIEDWDLDVYGIKKWEPKPEYGPIYQGVDWGGTNPFCVLWLQYLTTDVITLDMNFQPIVIKAKSYVLFSEIYRAGTDSAKLADDVMAREAQWAEQYGHERPWFVSGRFCDPQGRGDRNAWHRKGLKTTWPVITRQKERMIGTVQNLVIDGRFRILEPECPMFATEVEMWKKNPELDKEIDRDNHAMAAWRYGIANAETVERKKPSIPEDSDGTVDSSPAAAQRAPRNGVRRADGVQRRGGVAYTPGSSALEQRYGRSR